MSLKITAFEAENVKRIKAIQFEPSATGLTIVGGRNGQGKTSVLDAIAWTLGGNRMRPSDPHRSGSVQDPEIKITLNNGLIVERRGKNSDLKVTDPSGHKGGQAILDSLIGEMALNIPKFIEASSKEKAEYLLQIIGIGPQLAQLEHDEQSLVNQRLVIGQQARAKKAHADEMKSYPDAGDKEISASELIQKQQEILLKNAENARKRNQLERIQVDLKALDHQIKDLTESLETLKARKAQGLSDLEIAQKDALDLYDESTEEIEKSLASIDRINQQVRMNRAKANAEKEAEDLRLQYQSLSSDIELVRKNRMDLLNSAALPLPGLSVKDAEIQYNGHQWDGMSGSDQLRVATAICRAMNPECGFVLLDKLEQMDQETLSEFGAWLESEGLQAIATRVSTGDECSLIIEDGKVKGVEEHDSERSSQNSNLGTAWSW